MTPEYLTPALSASLLLLSGVTPFINPFFPLKKLTRRNEEQVEAAVSISVIITVSNKQSQALAAHLSQWLAQDYTPGYEVIVVAEKGDSEAEDILLQHSQFPNIYSTFVPQSSRYMSRKKLAITLGVKAAHNEWIILTDATCSPSNSQALQAFAQHCDDAHNLVMGYCNYDHEASPYYRFKRLREACHTLREAKRNMAYRAAGSILAFRKSEFIEGDGFRGNLQFARGEYDFLVNKYARPHQTAIASPSDNRIIQDAPTRHEWLNQHIFYMHTRKFLRRNLRHRILPFIGETLLHFTFIACLSTIAVGILTNQWILLGAGIAALLLNIVVRTVIANNTMKAFGEHIDVWRIYPYEIRSLWHHLSHKFRYLMSNKTDFTTHKLNTQH